jgi:hypothetical protein
VRRDRANGPPVVEKIPGGDGLTAHDVRGEVHRIVQQSANGGLNETLVVN